MIISHALVKRQSVTKSIVLVLLQEENVPTCVLVTSVLIATTLSTNHQINRSQRLIWSKVITIETCRRKWISNQFNFQNYDFNIVAYTECKTNTSSNITKKSQIFKKVVSNTWTDNCDICVQCQVYSIVL